jgi:hypothetical protein
MTIIGERQILTLNDIQNRTFYISTNIDRYDVINSITNFFMNSSNISNINNSIQNNIYSISSNIINVAHNDCHTINVTDIVQSNNVDLTINNIINGKTQSKGSNTNYSSISKGLLNSIIHNNAPYLYLEDIINNNLNIINTWSTIIDDINDIVNNAFQISNDINAISIDKIGMNPFNNPGEENNIFNILGANIYEIYIISLLSQGNQNYIDIPNPPETNTLPTKTDTTKGFVNSVASIVNDIAISQTNIINFINNKCTLGTISDISQFNEIKIKITNTISNYVGANSIVVCDNNTFQCVIATNLSNVFNYLYLQLVNEYNINIKSILLDTDFIIYSKAFDARIEILSAIELNTYYTICNNDKNLKCIMLQRFLQLGANISNEEIICGDNIPTIPRNPRVFKPNLSFLSQLLTPPYLYYLIGVVLIIVILLGFVIFNI